MLKKSDPGRTIVISAGNCADYTSLMAVTQYLYIVAALDRSAYDAIGLGVWDLKLGVSAVKEVASGAVTDIICANIEGFVPFLRFNKASGKLKVLVTSVIDPQLAELFKMDEVEISDPVDAISKLRKKIKHDIFILILHARGERIHQILSACTGVDLVIDGETGRIGKEIRVIAGKPLVCNNNKGKYVSYIDLVKAPDTSGFKVEQPVLTRVSAREVAEDSDIKALFLRYEDERHALFLAESKRQKHDGTRRYRSIENLYLGSNWCGTCHREIVEKWQKTRHAKAMSTLEEKRKAFDPECALCHVTGMGDMKALGGFVSIEATPQMVNVQCEACHGPGGQHAQSPHKIKMGNTGEKGCRSCHNRDTDPEFSYEKDFSILDHGKDR